MKTKSTQTKNTNMSFPNDSIGNPSKGNNIIDHSITIVVIIFGILLFSAFQLTAQEVEKNGGKDKIKAKNYLPSFGAVKTQNIKNPNAPQAISDKIYFKNEIGNSILTITDEGNDEGSITMSKMLTAPSIVDNKLYNVLGTLMFNGSTIGSTGAINDLSDAVTIGNSVFLGAGAGPNDDGSDNKNYGLGVNSLFSTTSGFSNASMGFNSLYFNTTGSYNIGIGQGSLYYNNTGSGNVAVGYHSNHHNQGGSNNTILGYQAGRGSATHDKSGNVFIGYQAGYNETSGTKLYIENTNSSSPLIWGDFANDDVKINGDFHVTGNLTSDNPISGSDNDWDVNGNELLLFNPSTQIVGIGTTITETSAKLHVKGDEGVLFQGTFSNGTTVNLGLGTRFHFYPKKSAIRGGFVNSTQWDDANIGNYSTAFGFNTTSSGFYSAAFGNGVLASNTTAFATGSFTVASGKWSTAMGSGSDAIGDYSTALSNNSKAESHSVTAIGRYNLGGGNQTSWVSTDPLFEIGIGTGDANRDNALTVLKNGNVGFGTASPAAKLDVNGTTKIGTNGTIISEIKKLMGTTDAPSFKTLINYPNGFTKDNTHVLSLEVQSGEDNSWVSIGAWDGGDVNSLQIAMNDNNMELWIPSGYYASQPYRIVLMRID